MRVAIISETFLPKVDGIVKVACLLLDHLRARGIEALVIAPRYGDVPRYKDVPIRSLPSLSFRSIPRRVWAWRRPGSIAICGASSRISRICSTRS